MDHSQTSTTAPADAPAVPLTFLQQLGKATCQAVAVVHYRPLMLVLDKIEASEKDYDVHNTHVVMAVALAMQLGLTAGFRFDPAQPAWPVGYIELPTGQVSWHLPEHGQPYDGHSTPEKYARLREFTQFIQ